MEIRHLVLVFGLLAASAALAQAYTWTDENGVVHYSDRPQPGAKEVVLPEQSRSRPRPAPATSRAPAADESAAAESGGPFRYTSLAISKPSAEETLWNIEGTLNVTVSLAPALQPGHQLRVYFDGTPQIVNGTSFRLDEVWRGVHNLQVEVIDEGGKMMIRSPTNRFYVQQATVL